MLFRSGVRFRIADVSSAEVIVEPDLDKMAAMIGQKDENDLYAVTCFSDKGKLFDRVKVLGHGVK